MSVRSQITAYRDDLLYEWGSRGGGVSSMTTGDFGGNILTFFKTPVQKEGVIKYVSFGRHSTS